MLSKESILYFENLLDAKIIAVEPLSGGDINEVFLLRTSQRKIVIKINSVSGFPGMFEAEALGLRTLQNFRKIDIPNVLDFGNFDDCAFLILEYISEVKPVKHFWEIFGEQLATLHQQTTPYFGFDNDNYIGSLPQFNVKCDTASEFYISQRLQPQFDLAIQKGFLFPDLEAFYKTMETEIPDEPSSFIHGDLWRGNFLINDNGLPCLIDPAVAYASREMDIAMMQLFGGFDSRLFEVYNEIFPFVKNWKDRLLIWQLYYQLVHLNLFGSSYYPKVTEVLKRYC